MTIKLKNILSSMRKNSHYKILRREPKKQHLSTVPKSCSFFKYIWIELLYYKSIYIESVHEPYDTNIPISYELYHIINGKAQLLNIKKKISPKKFSKK